MNELASQLDIELRFNRRLRANGGCSVSEHRRLEGGRGRFGITSKEGAREKRRTARYARRVVRQAMRATAPCRLDDMVIPTRWTNELWYY